MLNEKSLELKPDQPTLHGVGFSRLGRRACAATTARSRRPSPLPPAKPRCFAHIPPGRP
jgi:hypothetical protein